MDAWIRGFLGSASCCWLCLLAWGCDRRASSNSAPPSAPAQAAPHAAPIGPPLPFVDVTEQTGIRFAFQSGRSAGEYAILESLGGGVAAFDYDRDGRVDLMFAGGGSLADRRVTPARCGLFRNRGALRFDDATAPAGAAADAFYNHGAFPADFDNDGFLDLAVSGYGGLQLLRNLGDGTFQPQADWSDRPDASWSTSLAWGDFNGDGHLDLYAPHYVDWSWRNHPRCFASQPGVREVCAPKDFQALDDSLYLSDGAGRFVEASSRSGLVAGGKGLGAVAADVDLDGDTDLYVANDTTNNFLYLNQGDGAFRESAILAGVSGDEAGVSTGSMGVLVDDLDGDALPDIWVTNFERELFALYRNEGAALFTHVSRYLGLAALGGLYVGFGTVAIDFDDDGDRDLIVANGHVSYHSSHSPYLQKALLLENRGAEGFRLLAPTGYFAEDHSGRGLAYADLDDDGAWDLIFTNSEEPPAVLRARPPDHDRWALVRLVGTRSNRDGIGAHVLVDAGGQRQLFLQNGGGSYLSQSDARMRVTIPPGQTGGEALVGWPSGVRESFPLPPPKSEGVWIEGTGTPR